MTLHMSLLLYFILHSVVACRTVIVAMRCVIVSINHYLSICLSRTIIDWNHLEDDISLVDSPSSEAFLELSANSQCSLSPARSRSPTLLTRCVNNSSLFVLQCIVAASCTRQMPWRRQTATSQRLNVRMCRRGRGPMLWGSCGRPVAPLLRGPCPSMKLPSLRVRSDTTERLCETTERSDPAVIVITYMCRPM